MTGLPIVETKANDISAFIPTNVISITDGQCFLETDLFLSGVRPAVNVGTSVSRVGGAAQVKAMRQVSGSLRVDLAQFRDLEAFSAFASDLDDASKAQLARGQRMVELLKQGQYAPYPVEDQVVSIWAGTSGELDEVPVEDVRRFESEYVAWLKSAKPEILTSIAAKNEKLSDDQIELLKSSISEFKDSFEKADGQLLRGDVAVAPMDRAEVGQETITRHTKG
jgi:F-type H+-transporting ATPase subunit alpha